jgi:uncharacterized membrane protein
VTWVEISLAMLAGAFLGAATWRSSRRRYPPRTAARTWAAVGAITGVALFIPVVLASAAVDPVAVGGIGMALLFLAGASYLRAEMCLRKVGR